MAQNVFYVSNEVSICWIFQKAASDGGGGGWELLLAGTAETLVGKSSHGQSSYISLKWTSYLTLGSEMK